MNDHRPPVATLLAIPFRVEPGEDGSYVIYVGGLGDERGRTPRSWGFTNVDDMLRFLTDQATKHKAPGA